MKLQVTDLFKVLTIDNEGETKHGDAFVQCSALLFADDTEQYIRLVAFGHNAEYILDNHDGEHMRRAMASGSMEIEVKDVVVVKTVKGVKRKVNSKEVYYNFIVNSFRFIDKKTSDAEEDFADDEDEIEEDFADDDAIVEEKVKTPAKTKSGSKKISVEETDDVEIEVEDVKPKAGKRLRKPRA